jgi:hypothetical protein
MEYVIYRDVSQAMLWKPEFELLISNFVTPREEQRFVVEMPLSVESDGVA